MLHISPETLSLAVAATLILLYALYRAALPKPIPGIPYNLASANSLLGDVPAVLAHVSATGQIFPWLSAQNVKLNSPIVQVFGRPFGKPWVVITDFRESQDILLRRTKEFDRSEFLGDVFVGVVPESFVHMKSAETRYKARRYLMNPLMTPGFLNEVAAPEIYANMEKLVELWSLRAKLASGNPFSAAHDIYDVTLDAIVATALGRDSKEGTINAQIQLLSKVRDLELPENTNLPVRFPKVTIPELDSFIVLTESMETTVKSPSPRWHHNILRQFPYMRQAHRNKEQVLQRQIQRAVEKLQSGDHTSRSALDDILQRETKAAEKESRNPEYHSRAIYDEAFGLIIGGHETISTTLTWGIKYLADVQHVQQTLQQRLQAAFAEAASQNRNPSVAEITKTSIPYLDAVLEEMVRTAVTFPGVIRDTIADSLVFGHMIPKGTTVFLLHNGPGYFSDDFQVDDNLRSQSALTSKLHTGTWDSDDRNEFKPERWLTGDENDAEAFNPMAGPHLGFGLGPRGCYGRKLALLEMRIILVLLLWNFKLEKCPDDLSSYDAIDKLSRQPRMCFVRLAY